MGIHATTKYLEQFFENLLMNMNHELKNRYLRVDYRDDRMIQSENAESSKCIDNILNCTLEEMAVMKVIEGRPANHSKSFVCCIGKIRAHDQDKNGVFKAKRTDSKEKWKAQWGLGNIDPIITVRYETVAPD